MPIWKYVWTPQLPRFSFARNTTFFHSVKPIFMANSKNAFMNVTKIWIVLSIAWIKMLKMSKRVHVEISARVSLIRYFYSELFTHSVRFNIYLRFLYFANISDFSTLPFLTISKSVATHRASSFPMRPTRPTRPNHSFGQLYNIWAK